MNVLFLHAHVRACSIMSDSATHGQKSTRLLCLWNFPGKNTGVGFNFLLQRIFPTQGSNPCFFWFLHSAGGFFTTVPFQKPIHL